MFVFTVHSSQVGYSMIPNLLNQVVGVEGAVNKKFGSKLADDKWDGLNKYSVEQVGSVSASGMITDDSETLWITVRLRQLEVRGRRKYEWIERVICRGLTSWTVWASNLGRGEGRWYRERLLLCWRRWASTGCREILGLAHGLNSVPPRLWAKTCRTYSLQFARFCSITSQNLNLV